MTSVGEGVAVAAPQGRQAGRAKVLGIVGIVLGAIGTLIPATIILLGMIPGWMNLLWFLFFAMPVMAILGIVGIVVSIVGIAVGWRYRPVLAIIGVVVNAVVLGALMFPALGGMSLFS